MMAHPPEYVSHTPPAPPDDPLSTARAFQTHMHARRTIRHFSDKPVPRELIESIIATAGSAPSGANKQPWRFVAVQDPGIKHDIRQAAEREERAFYEHRATQDWLDDLAVLQTDADKPFIEEAPWLVVVFKLMEDDRPFRSSKRVYYVNESVGIATGMLLTAAHQAGLATLTHTPSPMGFLREVLQRPDYERAYMLIPMGWPAEGCRVPDIARKPLDQIMVVDRNGTTGSTNEST